MIEIFQAKEGFKLASIVLCLTMFEGMSLVIYSGRKQILQEIKEGTFEPIFEVEGIINLLKQISKFIAQKKETIFQKQVYHHNRQNEVFSNNF